MATIGLSKPYYAIYNTTSNAYSDGALLGKFTEMNISIDSADSNILYADNAACESDKSFGGGSFTMSTAELDAAVMQAILGATSDSTTTTGVTWTVFDDDQVVPYVGVGGVIKKRIGGVDKWVAFVLNKVQFSTPSIEATTQGDTIEWQTQEIEADILRSDGTKHEWFRISAPLSTEAEAEAAVKDILSIS